MWARPSGLSRSTTRRDSADAAIASNIKTYSLTIDGTYKVEVYLLDPAGGVSIFG